MNRERALKVALVLVGLLFTAAIFPLTEFLSHPSASDNGGDMMMLSLYLTLGILLLMSVRNPSEHRSLIAFAAWSSFAHGALMAMMAIRIPGDRDLLPGVYILAVIGTTLIVLRPVKPSVEPASAAA